MGDWMMQYLHLKPVTNEEIPNILLSLRISAISWDEIPVKLLKLSNCYIVQPLTFISNLSLSQGMFPDNMKQVNVIPFKSEDPMYFNHYRPVSLLVYFIKSLRKIYVQQIAGVSWKLSNLIENNLDSEKKIQPTRHLWSLLTKWLNPWRMKNLLLAFS